jgi:RNA polymerase sigma-70 factor (ECF subfamily)
LATLLNHSDGFYEQIIEPIEDRMIRSVWRITRNAQDAEDAMQNALVQIWKRRNRISSHPSPQALVLKICIDAACDIARIRTRQQRRTEPAGPDEQPVDCARSPWEELAGQELALEVHAAIRRLSRKQAVAITLRVLEELPYKEVAAAMECSESTVRKHVERARKYLQVELAKYNTGQFTRG